MNIAALPIDSPVESDITQISFWKLLDMDATISGSMKTLKESYNASLPSAKGRVRSPEYTTAKILVYLMAHEMEKLRLTKPEIYKIYLSDDCEYLPVSTNRGQLRTMMDEEYSLRSYSNFIDRLLDSQIILRKRNTSRLREKIVDKQGKVQEIIRLAPNGRGDFILHVNKKALTFNPVLLPSDNQAVTSPQVQNLQQPHSFETIKISNNNGGNVEKESAEPRPSILHRNRLRNEGNRPTDSTNPSAYFEKLEFENRIQRNLPRNQKDYFATLLFMQVKRGLYSKYSVDYLRQIEPHAKNLLRLHLQRLEQPIELAFQTVSRAIQLVKRYLETHPDAYLYNILTWLRIDDEYISGTLKVVVDQWVPKEEKRLLAYENQRADFVKWQYAVRYVDKVFLEVTKAFSSGFHSALFECQNGLKRIDSLFEKYELPQSTRTVLRKRYVDRISAIACEVKQLGKYPSTLYTNT